MAGRLSLAEMFSLIGLESAVPEANRALPFPGHVATDSRDVERGSAFLALEGERVDGHAYISQAAVRGAGLIIVRRGKRPENLSVPCVELEDPERDTARLASAYLKRVNPREVVAVTGSVGKTTTRAALQRVLGARFHLHAPERSFNTRIGCTATVLAMPLETELLLLEFGANKPGEIAELTELFPPTTALITQVAPVHLEGFGTIQGVLQGKMEILGSRHLRRFLYNADCELLHDALSGDFNASGVGMAASADFRIEDAKFTLETTPPGGRLPALTFRLVKQDRKKHAVFSAGVWGEHMATPMAFAAAVGNLLGLPLEDCAGALRGFQALEGRGRVLPLDGGRFLIDDAYNANPLSMGASLATFAGLELSRHEKMAILGEMREMGPEAVDYHRDLAALLDSIGNAVLVGGLWREAMKERPGLSFAADWQEALDLAKRTEWRGLLVKGSHSLGLQNVVAAFLNANHGEGGAS